MCFSLREHENRTYPKCGMLLQQFIGKVIVVNAEKKNVCNQWFRSPSFSMSSFERQRNSDLLFCLLMHPLLLLACALT